MRHFELLALVCIAFGLHLCETVHAIEVHGHRGSRGLRPENTLPSFQLALEAGADILEMDLAVTKDNVLVVSHDPHINSAICVALDGARIGEPPLIHSLTLTQVMQYDCGTLKNPRFPEQAPCPGTRIPTLDEVFALVRNSKHPNARRIGFNVETKISSKHPEHTVDPAKFARLVVNAIKKNRLLNRTILQSFDPRTLIEAHKLAPGLRLAFLVEDPKIDVLAEAKRIGVQIISPKYTLLTRERVANFQKNGFKVIPWTVNQPEDWDAMIAMGVDGIITDFPSRLIAHLKK